MCFSAPASFVTAAVTSAIGIVALTRVNEQRELPLAAMPLLFALQQGIEGLLWSNLPLAPDGSFSRALTLLYLFFAEAFWALYAAIAAWLVERSEHRRRLMGICLGVGAGVGAYLLWWNLDHPQVPTILDGHIVYLTKYWPSYAVGVAYAAATGLPLLLSSQRTVFVFNLQQKRVERRGGRPPAKLGLPIGLAVDDRDRLFVSDAGLHQITCFEPDGEVLAAIDAVTLDEAAAVAGEFFGG